MFNFDDFFRIFDGIFHFDENLRIFEKTFNFDENLRIFETTFIFYENLRILEILWNFTKKTKENYEYIVIENSIIRSQNGRVIYTLLECF